MVSKILNWPFRLFRARRVRQIAPLRCPTSAHHCDHGFLWAVPFRAKSENNKAATQKLDVVFPSSYYFQVNTLDETSRNTGKHGTNYTIPCRSAYSWPIRTISIRNRLVSARLRWESKSVQETCRERDLTLRTSSSGGGRSGRKFRVRRRP